MLMTKYEMRTIYPSSYDSLTYEDQRKIDMFIEDAIAQAHNEQKSFTIRDLVGRSVYATWAETPLDPIYQYHKAHGTINPVRQAGIDVGNLFKNAMAKSGLNFILEKQFVNHYTPV